jgi:hypothetical protein
VSGIPKERKERGVRKFAMNGKSISEKGNQTFHLPSCHGVEVPSSSRIFIASFFLSFFTEYQAS